MQTGNPLLSPCGLYCGLCGIFQAHRDNNQELKQKLAKVYGLPVEEIHCQGCKGEESERFIFCGACPVRACNFDRGYEGCYQCSEFPCTGIENFPVAEGKSVILRTIPQWKEKGTNAWIAAELERYLCPECGKPLYRGRKTCPSCKCDYNPESPKSE
jgi:hypothetical protein